MVDGTADQAARPLRSLAPGPQLLTAGEKSPVTGDCHAGIRGSRELRRSRRPDHFAATTGRSACERRVDTQCLRVSCLGTLPLATLEACDPGRRIDARLLTFRARAADQAHAAFTPGTAWPVIGTPARLITREQPDPSLSMPPRFS